jgi:hypothetical protein
MVHFTRVNPTACELHLNKAVTTKKNQWPIGVTQGMNIVANGLVAVSLFF